jgi:type II secretory pathway component PulK
MRMHASTIHNTSQRRPGVALVVALALLALAAALLASSFASAVSLARAARSTRATVYAETIARRAAAEAFAAWQIAGDSLAIHAYEDREPTVSQSFGHAVVRTRLQRISARLYAVIADVRIGDSAALLAHRRCRLVVERSAKPDGAGTPGTPRPIAYWSFADIY